MVVTIKNNGAYYSCNLNRSYFLHIPSSSTRRHICLSANSSQLGYKAEISAESLVMLVRVILLFAHKVIIGFGHGYFVIMERASI